MARIILGEPWPDSWDGLAQQADVGDLEGGDAVEADRGGVGGGAVDGDLHRLARDVALGGLGGLGGELPRDAVDGDALALGDLGDPLGEGREVA